MIQGSDEWLRARAGKFTASTAKDLMSKGRGKAPSKTRETLIKNVVGERLSGRPMSTATNFAMQRGTELEPAARATYSLTTGQIVQEVAFVEMPKMSFAGCSPDGLVGDDGLIEIKCPLVYAKHVNALLGDLENDEYRAQRQMQMLVTGRKWCDAVSYYPEFSGTNDDIAIVRIERDNDYCEEIRKALVVAEAEAQELMSKIAEAA